MVPSTRSPGPIVFRLGTMKTAKARNSRSRNSNPRKPANLVEALVIKLASHYLGYRLLILPYLPAAIVPASWIAYGKVAGWIGIGTCVLAMAFGVVKTEQLITRLDDSSDVMSISGRFASFLFTGLILSALTFLPLTLL